MSTQPDFTKQAEELCGATYAGLVRVERVAAAIAAAYSQGREEHNDLVDLADAFVNYRDRVGPLGFQLEKADFWFDRLRAALASRPTGTPPEAGNG